MALAISGLFVLATLPCGAFLVRSNDFLDANKASTVGRQRPTPLYSASTFEDPSHQDVSCEILNVTGDAMSAKAILVRAEDDDDVDCLPPGATPTLKMIFLVSDATGVTARSTLLKSLAQFDSCADDLGGLENNNVDGETDGLFGDTCDVQSRTFTFIRSTSALSQILQSAKEKEACVLYTLADPVLRRYTAQVCREEKIHNVDLMGPALDMLGGFLGKEPFGIPARFEGRNKRRALGDSYYQRMDAVEFCLKADDGQAPWLLSEADVVIVGVSRSGKTPLSVVLAQTMSLKTANIPLVLEVPPPTQLLEQVDPRRVFCLTIAPTQLKKIRSSRLERRNVRAVEAMNEATEASQSTYADRNYLLKDLQSARRLAQQHNWTEIDVTGRAVEETATIIVEIFNERFQQNVSPNSLR